MKKFYQRLSIFVLGWGLAHPWMGFATDIDLTEEKIVQLCHHELVKTIEAQRPEQIKVEMWSIHEWTSPSNTLEIYVQESDPSHPDHWPYHSYYQVQVDIQSQPEVCAVRELKFLQGNF